jgi:hypothetical protein
MTELVIRHLFLIAPFGSAQGLLEEVPGLLPLSRRVCEQLRMKDDGG